MPTQTTSTPTLKRFIVTVPALYWDRDEGLADGFGFQTETRAPSAREALDEVLPQLLPVLCRTQAHFRTFQVAVARCSRNPARQTIDVYKVRRSGRVTGHELRPWM